MVEVWLRIRLWFLATWNFVKRFYWYFVAALLGVLALALVLFRLRSWANELWWDWQAVKHEGELGHLNKKRQVIKKSQTISEHQVQELDKQIDELHKKALAMRLRARGLSLEEVAKEMTKMGF